MKTLFFATALAALCAVSTPAQDWAASRLEKSPRHREYVTIKQGTNDLLCYVAYPEVKDKATAVLVIHEIFGLSDWAKLEADELAAAGYVAIAPDLLSGKGTNGGGTSAMSSTAIGQAINALSEAVVTADLNAAAEYVVKLPAANGKLVVAGFCWGGTQSFRFATTNKNIKAAFVFYGTPPAKAEDFARVSAPVYGFYAENDARVSSTIPAATDAMKSAGKKYEPVTYAGAGHGFMRAGDDPNGTAANKKARDDAWKRLTDLLKGI